MRFTSLLYIHLKSGNFTILFLRCQLMDPAKHAGTADIKSSALGVTLCRALMRRCSEEWMDGWMVGAKTDEINVHFTYLDDEYRKSNRRQDIDNNQSVMMHFGITFMLLTILTQVAECKSISIATSELEAYI